MKQYTASEILKIFYKNHPDLMKKMKQTEHGYMGVYKNPYHLEGSVWTHTMLVMKLAELNYGTNVMLFSALLHDIGKTETVLDQTNQRRSFRNHEAVSFFMISDILNSYDLTEPERLRIYNVVANHGNLYQFFENGRIPEKNFKKIQQRFKKETLIDLFNFYSCDHQGRFHSTEKFDVEDELYNDFETITETCPTIYPQNLYSNVIVLSIGLPRSGKSSFISKWFKDCALISRDQIVEEYPGLNYSDKWKNLTQEDQKNIDLELQKRFSEAVKNKENIVIDMTNLSKKTRKKWLNGSNLNSYYKHALVFPTSIKTCISRNDDIKHIPENVIKSMAGRFYFPDYEEFDKIDIKESELPPPEVIHY